MATEPHKVGRKSGKGSHPNSRANLQAWMGKGRVPGVPNKANSEFKQFLQEEFKNPKFRKNLHDKIESLELNPTVMAACLIHAFGDPKRVGEHDGAGQSGVIDLTDVLKECGADVTIQVYKALMRISSRRVTEKAIEGEVVGGTQ